MLPENVNTIEPVVSRKLQARAAAWRESLPLNAVGHAEAALGTEMDRRKFSRGEAAEVLKMQLKALIEDFARTSADISRKFSDVDNASSFPQVSLAPLPPAVSLEPTHRTTELESLAPLPPAVPIAPTHHTTELDCQRQTCTGSLCRIGGEESNIAGSFPANDNFFIEFGSVSYQTDAESISLDQHDPKLKSIERLAKDISALRLYQQREIEGPLKAKEASMNRGINQYEYSTQSECSTATHAPPMLDGFALVNKSRALLAQHDQHENTCHVPMEWQVEDPLKFYIADSQTCTPSSQSSLQGVPSGVFTPVSSHGGLPSDTFTPVSSQGAPSHSSSQLLTGEAPAEDSRMKQLSTELKKVNQVSRHSGAQISPSSKFQMPRKNANGSTLTTSYCDRSTSIGPPELPRCFAPQMPLSDPSSATGNAVTPELMRQRRSPSPLHTQSLTPPRPTPTTSTMAEASPVGSFIADVGVTRSVSPPVTKGIRAPYFSTLSVSSSVTCKESAGREDPLQSRSVSPKSAGSNMRPIAACSTQNRVLNSDQLASASPLVPRGVLPPLMLTPGCSASRCEHSVETPYSALTEGPLSARLTKACTHYVGGISLPGSFTTTAPGVWQQHVATRSTNSSALRSTSASLSERPLLLRSPRHNRACAHSVAGGFSSPGSFATTASGTLNEVSSFGSRNMTSPGSTQPSVATPNTGSSASRSEPSNEVPSLALTEGFALPRSSTQTKACTVGSADGMSLPGSVTMTAPVITRGAWSSRVSTPRDASSSSTCSKTPADAGVSGMPSWLFRRSGDQSTRSRPITPPPHTLGLSGRSASQQPLISFALNFQRELCKLRCSRDMQFSSGGGDDSGIGSNSATTPVVYSDLLGASMQKMGPTEIPGLGLVEGAKSVARLLLPRLPSSVAWQAADAEGSRLLVATVVVRADSTEQVHPSTNFH